MLPAPSIGKEGGNIEALHSIPVLARRSLAWRLRRDGTTSRRPGGYNAAGYRYVDPT